MQQGFIIVKVSVPISRLDLMKEYNEYMLNRVFDTSEYALSRAEDFRASFGPDAESTVISIGIEDV